MYHGTLNDEDYGKLKFTLELENDKDKGRAPICVMKLVEFNMRETGHHPQEAVDNMMCLLKAYSVGDEGKPVPLPALPRRSFLKRIFG